MAVAIITCHYGAHRIRREYKFQPYRWSSARLQNVLRGSLFAYLSAMLSESQELGLENVVIPRVTGRS